MLQYIVENRVKTLGKYIHCYGCEKCILGVVINIYTDCEMVNFCHSSYIVRVRHICHPYHTLLYTLISVRYLGSLGTWT